MKTKYRIEFVKVGFSPCASPLYQPKPQCFYQIKQRCWFGWTPVSILLTKKTAEELIQEIQPHTP